MRPGGALGGIVERRGMEIHEGRPERRAMALTRTASGVCVANLHATNDFPALAVADLLRAARAAVEFAGGAPLLFGGDLNLRPRRNPEVFAELAERHDLTGTTAPEAIDHLLAREMAAVEPPSPWPPGASRAARGRPRPATLRPHPGRGEVRNGVGAVMR